MNALLFSGICKIRYQKEPSPVPNMRAVLKKASYGTRRVFKGAKQPTPQTVNSLLCTGRVFKGAKQPTPIRAPLIIQ